MSGKIAVSQEFRKSIGDSSVDQHLVPRVYHIFLCYSGIQPAGVEAQRRTALITGLSNATSKPEHQAVSFVSFFRTELGLAAE